MVMLVLLMLLILLTAAAVVIYVAYPHRGEDVPVAPWLGDVMQRGVETVGDLLDAPSAERDREHTHR